MAITNNNGNKHNPNRQPGGAYGNNQFSEYPDYSDEEIDLHKVISLAAHYRWSIVSFMVASTVIFGIIAFIRLPVYQSNGTLIISNVDNSNLPVANSNISNLIQNAYGIGTANNINDELQILKSRSLIMDVARSLKREKFQSNGMMFPSLWRSFPDDSSIVSVDTVYERIQRNLTIDQISQQSNAVRITVMSYSPPEAAHLVELTMNAYTDFSTRENRFMARSALNFLKKEGKRIQSRLDSAEVQLKSFMKKKQLVDLDDQTKQLITTLTDIQNQREQVEVQRVAITSAINNYQVLLDSLRPGLPAHYAEALSPTLKLYQYQLADLKTKAMMMISKNPSIKNNPYKEPEYRKLANQISSLQQNIRKMTSQLIEKSNGRYLGFLNSDNGEAGREVATMHDKLLELQVKKVQYDAQIEVMNKRLAELNRFFTSLPGNMIRLIRLKRDVSLNETLFKTIAQQASEMALRQQTQSGLGRIIDHGFVPLKPVKPKKVLYLLLGMIAGMFFSVAYIFIKESVTTSINSVEKLKKQGMPILAVIPDIRSYIRQYFSNSSVVEVRNYKVSTNLISLFDTMSPIAEAFSRLQTNIVYSHPDRSIKTVVVSSAREGEGKTTLISNLAIALAETDKNVLLVDCDLRRPRVYKLFGVSNNPGISDIIFKDRNPNEVIKESVVPNIRLLTTGVQSPNPKTVIGSNKLRDMLKYLTIDFDYVLIDTPPYGMITEAAPLITMADGVILAVQFNRTREAELEQTYLQLQQINANVLGTVLTGYDHNKSMDYNYKRYYKSAYKSYDMNHNNNENE